jgi:hypothetical protein
MRGTIEIGGYQAECVIEAIGNVWTVEMLPTCESTDVIIGAVPRAKARVTTSAGTFDGEVIITDREDYVTQVEMDVDYDEEDLR